MYLDKSCFVSTTPVFCVLWNVVILGVQFTTNVAREGPVVVVTASDKRLTSFFESNTVKHLI